MEKQRSSDFRVPLRGDNLVKCLLCKQEDPSLPFRTHIKYPGMMADSCNPCTVAMEMGGSWGLLTGQTNLLGNFQANKRPYLKNRAKRYLGTDT